MRYALSQSHLLLDFNFNLGFFCVVNLKSFYGLNFFVFVFVFVSKRLKLWVVDKFFVVVWAIQINFCVYYLGYFLGLEGRRNYRGAKFCFNGLKFLINLNYTNYFEKNKKLRGGCGPPKPMNGSVLAHRHMETPVGSPCGAVPCGVVGLTIP